MLKPRLPKQSEGTHVIVGLDFLCKMGTTIRYGPESLVLTASPNPDHTTNHQPHHDRGDTIMEGRQKHKETTSNAEHEAQYDDPR